jgi:hypothetical protein
MAGIVIATRDAFDVEAAVLAGLHRMALVDHA